jgi:hypothetical protein
MAKQASNTAAPAAPAVKLSPVDAARLATKDVLKKANNVEGIDASGKATSIDVNNPSNWQDWGARLALADTESVTILTYARALLKDAPYAVWVAFLEVAVAGAALTHKQPGQLISRTIIVPLAAEGIKKPVSPTSTNARKDAAGVTVAEKKAKAAELLAANMLKLTDADIAKEIATATPDRRVELLGEMTKREKAKVKADAAKIVEQKAAAKKSLNDAINMLTPMQCVTLLGFATAILQSEKDATALYQHCAKVLDQYDNAKAGSKKTAKKTKH